MTVIGQLAFVGLGVMGFPICRNIMRKSGLPMRVYEPRREASEAMASLGGSVAGSAAEAVKDADIAFTCLPGEPQLRAAIFGDGGLAGAMRRDATLVDLSTAPVDFVREAASALGERGIHFADAPIARTRQAAEDGTLSITVGASPEIFARIEPILRHAATDVTHCGPVGCGQVVKLMNNMVLIETVIALSEARAIARRAGVSPELLFDALSKGSADSFALRNHGMKAVLPGAFPERAFSTDYALKDLSYALRLAAMTGVAAKGAEQAKAALDASRAAGNAEAYWPIVSRVIDGAA